MILELREFATSVLLARIEPDHLRIEMVEHASDTARVYGVEELIMITGSWIVFKFNLVGNS